MEHKLKTWPEYFEAIQSGKKTFELRKNDRNFMLGDTLVLQEWKPQGYSAVSPNELTGKYTGNEVRVKVTYVFIPPAFPSFGLHGDHCIMSIEVAK